MKLTVMASGSMAALAAAGPLIDVPLEKRQSNYCFVWARGSTEPGGMGITIGPKLQSALQRSLPGLKTFPVQYAASIATNVSIDRTDAASIAKGVAAFNQARGCKTIVAGGYSQGAAVMGNVIAKSLEVEIKAKIAGVALFGSTRNKQDGGHIRNFPQERAKTWCNANDGVCGGGLSVNAGHLSYSSSQINQAASYLTGLAKSHTGSTAGISGPDPNAFKGAASFGGGSSGGGLPSGGGGIPKGKGKGGLPKGKGSAPPAPEPAAPEPAAPEPAAPEEPAEPAAEE